MLLITSKHAALISSNFCPYRQPSTTTGSERSASPLWILATTNHSLVLCADSQLKLSIYSNRYKYIYLIFR